MTKRKFIRWYGPGSNVNGARDQFANDLESVIQLEIEQFVRECVIPTRLVVAHGEFKKLLRRIKRPGKPTPALVALMQDR